MKDNVSPGGRSRLPDAAVSHHGVGAEIAPGEKATQGKRTLIDAYRPHRSLKDILIREMLPQIIGRGFKVGAMMGRPQQTERGAEPGLFEKIFMARFEGGVPLGEKLEKGQFKFLAKSEKGWGEFFQKFVAFAMQKKGNLNNVQALVVRGMLKPDGTLTPQAKVLVQQAKVLGMLVSDLKFSDGKTDKFARLLIQNPQVMQKLASMPPGESISHDLLMQWAEAFGGLEFVYQALSHRVVNPEMVKGSESPIAEAYQTPEKMKEAAIRQGVRDSTQGIALSARTEQAMAERLDINLNKPTIRAGAEIDGQTSSRGRASTASEGLPTAPANTREDGHATAAMKGAAVQMGGIFTKKKKGLFGRDADDATGGVFVPWYQQIIRPQKFKGRPRWWVPLVYLAAVSTACFGLLYVFRYWIQ